MQQFSKRSIHQPGGLVRATRRANEWVAAAPNARTSPPGSTGWRALPQAIQPGAPGTTPKTVKHPRAAGATCDSAHRSGSNPVEDGLLCTFTQVSA